MKKQNMESHNPHPRSLYREIHPKKDKEVT